MNIDAIKPVSAKRMLAENWTALSMTRSRKAV